MQITKMGTCLTIASAAICGSNPVAMTTVSPAVMMTWATQARQICDRALGKADGVISDGRVLCFSGSVPSRPESIKLQKELAAADIFVVRSMGGPVNSALDIAQTLASRPRAIVVMDYCLSSCANYWFLGARYKVVGKNDAVGFHGGPPEERVCDEKKLDCAALRRDFARSNSFLTSRGVDPAILYSPPAGYDLAQRDTKLWVPKKSDLEHWGVTGLLRYDIDPR